VISPISFQSTAPGVGSTYLGTPAQLDNQYTRAGLAGVISTRIYTTVGASGTAAPCNTPGCPYGGAVKALQQASRFNMTGATRRGARGGVWRARGARRAPPSNAAASARARAARRAPFNHSRRGAPQ
jgi:hypothetical protein